VTDSESGGATAAAYLAAGAVYVCVHQYSYTDSSWFVGAIGVYDDDHVYITLPSGGAFAFSTATATTDIPVEFDYEYAMGTNSIMFAWDGVMASGTTTSSNTLKCSRSETSDFALTSLETYYEMVSDYYYTFSLDTDEEVDIMVTFEYEGYFDADTMDYSSLSIAYYDEDGATWTVVDSVEFDSDEMTVSYTTTSVAKTWMVVYFDFDSESSDDGSGMNAITIAFAFLIAAFSLFY